MAISKEWKERNRERENTTKLSKRRRYELKKQREIGRRIRR